MEWSHRISVDPDIMGGKACVRGLRVTVSMIIASLAAGRSVEDLQHDFPYLCDDDIRAALGYGAEMMQGRLFDR